MVDVFCFKMNRMVYFRLNITVDDPNVLESGGHILLSCHNMTLLLNVTVQGKCSGSIEILYSMVKEHKHTQILLASTIFFSHLLHPIFIVKNVLPATLHFTGFHKGFSFFAIRPLFGFKG